MHILEYNNNKVQTSLKLGNFQFDTRKRKRKGERCLQKYILTNETKWGDLPNDTKYWVKRATLYKFQFTIQKFYPYKPFDLSQSTTANTTRKMEINKIITKKQWF